MCSFVIDMEMYAEIRSNVIDKLVSLAGKKHGIAFLEGGKQTTRYEAGIDWFVILIFRYRCDVPSGLEVPLPFRCEGA